MIKAVGFALYGPLAASHRVRLAQYRKGLAEAGIDLTIHSLLGNEYLQSRFHSLPTPVLPVLDAYFDRIKILFGKQRFDIAIVHCELFPFFPWRVEHTALKIPFIYDFDDAYYLRYRVGNLAWLNPILGRKFDHALRCADAITAGSEHLAIWARLFNKNVTVLPSVVDTARFAPDPSLKNPTFTIGWLGSPSTAKYLQYLTVPLETLGQDRRVRLLVIGGKAPPIKGVEILEFPWSESTEVQHINSFDVGIMPLPDDEWARGKCAFKLVQYMACGVPVVASRVGSNIDLVTKDCGFLVSTPDGWVDAIRQLCDQPLMRQRMGESSRKRVIASYSLGSNLPLLANVIHKVVANY
jgi:glycosyltransferase involved in cell wall biosynthesis